VKAPVQVELSALLESMDEAIFVFDLEGELLQVNSAAERLAHRPAADLLGRTAGDLSPLFTVEEGGQPVEFPGPIVELALHGERLREKTHMFLRQENTPPIEALVSATPIRTPKGDTTGALVAVRDVTEVRRLQRHLAETERHLAVGQMATGLAHDLNNVLNTIGQAATVANSRLDAPAPERRTYLQMIQNAVRNGAEIIRSIREYVRDSGGRREPVDVCRLLLEALELTHPLWSEKDNVHVVRELNNVPPVFANPPDLRRVFTNLIINALQAMPNGGTLAVQCNSRNGHVVAAIRDTGQGIPPEQQKKIFFPYFTTKAYGTGLGLSGAYRTVLSQGGTIRVESEVGKGSRFIVEFPVAAGAQQQPPKAA
jgi:PAS domain S-box-containing protein